MQAIIKEQLEAGKTLSEIVAYLEDGEALKADGIKDQAEVEQAHTTAKRCAEVAAEYIEGGWEYDGKHPLGDQFYDSRHKTREILSEMEIDDDEIVTEIQDIIEWGTLAEWHENN